jgi:hypothetical protein
VPISLSYTNPLRTGARRRDGQTKLRRQRIAVRRGRQQQHPVRPDARGAAAQNTRGERGGDARGSGTPTPALLVQPRPRMPAARAACARRAQRPPRAAAARRPRHVPTAPLAALSVAAASSAPAATAPSTPPTVSPTASPTASPTTVSPTVSPNHRVCVCVCVTRQKPTSHHAGGGSGERRALGRAPLRGRRGGGGGEFSGAY